MPFTGFPPGEVPRHAVHLQSQLDVQPHRHVAEPRLQRQLRPLRPGRPGGAGLPGGAARQVRAHMEPHGGQTGARALAGPGDHAPGGRHRGNPGAVHDGSASPSHHAATPAA